MKCLCYNACVLLLADSTALLFAVQSSTGLMYKKGSKVMEKTATRLQLYISHIEDGFRGVIEDIANRSTAGLVLAKPIGFQTRNETWYLRRLSQVMSFTDSMTIYGGGIHPHNGSDSDVTIQLELRVLTREGIITFDS